MKVIRKNVYYCDFCKKKGLAGGAMKTHEKHCTLNPNRHCRMCQMSTTIEETVQEYKSRFELIPNEPKFISEIGNMDEFIVKWIGEPITIKELMETHDNCPTCILAILRQTGMNKHYFHFEYDYQTEFARAMIDKKQREEDDRSPY